MVSFQQQQHQSISSLPIIPPPNIPNQTKTSITAELFDHHHHNSINSSKKRKWEITTKDHDQENFDYIKLGSKKNFSFYDIEFELEKPLPLEWQRCLDIQSGQVHFYNTRTHKRTCKDPRQQQQSSDEQQHHHHHHHQHMSLDLELNLPYNDQSIETTTNNVDDNWTNTTTTTWLQGDKSRSEKSLSDQKTTKNSSCCFDGFTSSSGATTTDHSSSTSWLTSLEVDHREMVAVVCMRCHMLVMLCKATPSCPNCKFIYPPEQTPASTNLSNKITKQPRLRLLCSNKD